MNQPNDTTIESLLLDRIKVIGDNEFTLLGTPADLIQAIPSQLKQAEIRGRIDELENIYHSREVIEGSLAKVLMVIAARLKELNKIGEQDDTAKRN